MAEFDTTTVTLSPLFILITAGFINIYSVNPLLNCDFKMSSNNSYCCVPQCHSWTKKDSNKQMYKFSYIPQRERMTFFTTFALSLDNFSYPMISCGCDSKALVWSQIEQIFIEERLDSVPPST